MARNAIESYLRTSKMAAGGHFVKKFKKNKVPYGSEMARNAIESEFRTSKMADQSEMARNAIQSDFQTSKISHFVKYFKKKKCIDVKWPEMRSKVNFGHPKWTSQMADVSHFVKNFKKKIRIDLKWPEMRSKVNFGHPKWPIGSSFCQKFPK